MNSKENSIDKMCSFYVSDWHFTTMMLPYMSKLLEEDTQIEMILEQGVEEKIKTLISKLNMNPETKQKIFNINWNTNQKVSLHQPKEAIRKKRVVIMNGTKQKMDKINQMLEEETPLEEKRKMTIINCYAVDEIKENMQEILENYDQIINTSGKHKVNELFPKRKNA